MRSGVVPHHEKMLHDNGLVLRVHLQLWRATGDDRVRRVTDETAALLLDADTDGVEA